MGWKKASILQHSTFFMVQLSHPYMTIGKTIAWTIQTFVGKVMSLLFNMLSRFVIAFLSMRKYLLISWLQSPSAEILEPSKIICHCFHCFCIYLPWSDRTWYHDLSFLIYIVTNTSVTNKNSYNNICKYYEPNIGTHKWMKQILTD